MALQGTISGINQIDFGGQGVLTANFTDTETGQTPAGLQYDWRASDGSFIGATNGPSVTYLADPAQNIDQAVTITCEVTLPGNPNPTVSAPSLTAMDRTRHHRAVGEYAGHNGTEWQQICLIGRTTRQSQRAPTVISLMTLELTASVGPPTIDLHSTEQAPASSEISGMPQHSWRIPVMSSSTMGRLLN